MRTILLLVRQELRVIFSDKKALALLFVMPALLILFLSLALTDIYQQKVGKRLQVAFLMDDAEMPKKVMNLFADLGYSVAPVFEHTGIEDYILKHKDEVVVEIPQNFSKMVRKKDFKERVKIFFDPSLDNAYAELVKSHFLISMQAMVIDQVNVSLEAMAKESGDEQTVINKLSSSGQVMSVVGRGSVIPNPIQQTVPAWSLFAMFFIALPMAGSFIRDRETGILKRLLCYNISKSKLLIGKLIPYVLINNIQFYVMFFLGLYIIPHFTNSDFKMSGFSLSLVVISFVCSLAATAYGLLVSTLAKSGEQAASFGAISVVIMSLFGGVMIPNFAMPEFMKTVSVLSPLYWGLESYLDLFLRDFGLYEILPRLGILLLFSGFAFVVSLTKFRWSE